jgi:hypothetical protein
MERRTGARARVLCSSLLPPTLLISASVTANDVFPPRQLDAVVEFTTAHEKGRWCVSVDRVGRVLQHGLFIESSLILTMPLPLHLLQPAFAAAVASEPLLCVRAANLFIVRLTEAQETRVALRVCALLRPVACAASC